MSTTVRRRPVPGERAAPGRPLVAGGTVGGLVGGTVGVLAATGLAGPGVPPPLLLSAVRPATDGAGVVAVGFAVLLMLARREAGPARLARVALAAVGPFWAGSALVGLWLHAADAALVAPTRVGVATVLSYVGTLAHGRGLVLTAVCGYALSAVLVPRVWDGVVRRPELVLGVALLGVLPGPVGGHAAGEAGHAAAVVLIAVHVGAAAVWVGGLLAVLMAGHRYLLARFSPVAAWCLLAVTIGGAGSAALRLASAEALVSTGYGRLILVKTLGLLALAATGWWVRGRLRTATVPRLVGVLVAELGLMSALVGVAAVLALSAP